MRIISYFILTILIFILLTGCLPHLSKIEHNPRFYEQHPISILVLPARNMTTAADATDHFRFTITKSLTEQGYYIFPVHLVDKFFKSEHLTDAELVRNIPIKKLKEIFSADAILYVDILSWDTKYSVVQSSVDVGFSFSLVNAETEEEIWKNISFGRKVAGVSGAGIIEIVGGLIDAAINTSFDYTDLASGTNAVAARTMPFGKYHKKYSKDHNDVAIRATNTLGSSIKDNKLHVWSHFIDPSVPSVSQGSLSLRFMGQNKTIFASLRDPYFFRHSDFKDYYYTHKEKKQTYTRHRFFSYERNMPYLLVSGKKVFVRTEDDGTIPYHTEVKQRFDPLASFEERFLNKSEYSYNVYYFYIEKTVDLKSSI